MGENSKISWTDHTFNPWRGCAKISDGCANCYAEVQSQRNPKVLGIWGNDGTRVVASEAKWKEPLKWNRRAEKTGNRERVFSGSMCDVFEDWAELHNARVRLFGLVEQTPKLDWLLLTKRPENYYRMLQLDLGEFPFENIWLGVSVENQAAADKRIPILLDTPAAVRFFSCEPLLGTVDLSDYLAGLDWMIVGGESGPHARSCNTEWLRSIRDQCEDAGVACFVKQLGSRPHLSHPKGGDPDEWPVDLRVREFPKTKEGTKC